MVHASGEGVVWHAVGWLCDSAGAGLAVIKQRKGEKGREQAIGWLCA